MKTAIRLGVDGCRAGWFAVGLSAAGAWRIGVFQQIADLADAYPEAELILIDMPIGLPSAHSRACDHAARRLLGRRASSIFPVPCRAASAATDYAQACAINAEALGVRLSRQSWNILPKIRELDDYLQASRDRRWRECHPELAFKALNGGHVLAHSKKSQEGRTERFQLLERLLPTTSKLFAAARSGYRQTLVADDDIFDALALAMTAWKPLASLPAVAEFDATGLPMEIVFASTRPNQPNNEHKNGSWNG